MTDADKGTMIATLRRHFPALEWRWYSYLTSAAGSQRVMSDLLDVTVSVIRRSSGRYTASVSRFTVDVEFQNDDLHRLIVDMQRHLRQVAMFHLRAAGGVVGDSSTPWMKELEAIDNEDNRELRIARQEALALHIADLEAEFAQKPTVA